MNELILILKADIEGGSITLYRQYSGNGWIFRNDIADQTPMLIDEPAIYSSSKQLFTWKEALGELDSPHGTCFSRWKYTRYFEVRSFLQLYDESNRTRLPKTSDSATGCRSATTAARCMETPLVRIGQQGRQNAFRQPGQCSSLCIRRSIWRRRQVSQRTDVEVS